MMTSTKNKTGIVLVAIALLLFVFLFPWKYSNGYTCLGDRYLSMGSNHRGMMMGSGDHLIERYVYPYGLMWLGSITILYLVVLNWSLSKKDKHK